ncbi:MAG: endonuclease NucS domain-containing protein [Candidatus Aenigmatarchaeota archaeon]
MIFSVDEEEIQLKELQVRNFSDLNILERKDIEEWVVKEPRILGEDLLIITTEYDNYEKIRNRLDVLALDKNGKLVVIELKRDKADKTTDLQAIKYASYVATLTAEDLQKEYGKFQIENSNNELSPEEVGEIFKNFLSNTDLEVNIDDNGWAEFELDNKPRIILAAGDFGKEITAPVVWLRDEYGIDITCIELNPLKHEGEILLNSRILIPIPETEEYMAKRREKKESEEKKTRKRAIKVLLDRGVLEEGEEVVFNKENLPPKEEWKMEPDEDFWKARVTGKTGQSDNIIWLYDNDTYSFSGLTRKVLNKLIGRNEDKAINGYIYWCHPKFENRTLRDLRNSKVKVT